MELKKRNAMHYWLYTPENPAPGKPLVVFLHGAAERGGDPNNVFRIAVPKLLRDGIWQPDAWVIMPQCKDGYDWNSQVERVKEIIDYEAAQLEVDRTRISITGISMGGFGTWAMGLHYPRFFSAMAPVCGGGLSWRCSNLKDMPLRAFHGEQDSLVPLRNSQEMVAAVNAAGGNATLTVFPQCAHNCWDATYGTTDVLAWLLEQRREDPQNSPYFADVP